MGVLRLLLALSVVANHFGAIGGTALVGGKIAVQAFFIISGFYMSLILTEKYIDKDGSNNYKLFISNRFLRIYPIYWAVVALNLLTYVVLVFVFKKHSVVLEDYGYLMNYPVAFLFLVVANSIIFGLDIAMFTGVDTKTGNLFFTNDFSSTNPAFFKLLLIPQAWTLSLELMFYIIAPIVFKKGFKVILLVIGLSFFLRLFIYDYLDYKHDPWTYRFFPTELMFFMLGNLSYRVYLRIKKTNLNKNKFINVGILIVLIVFTIFYFNIWDMKIATFPFSVKETLYFLYIIISIPFLFNYFKNIKFDSQIGELSYPVYISHIFVGMICVGTHLSFLNQSYIIAILTLIFSYLLNKFITEPIEKYRQGRVLKVV